MGLLLRSDEDHVAGATYKSGFLRKDAAAREDLGASAKLFGSS